MEHLSLVLAELWRSSEVLAVGSADFDGVTDHAEGACSRVVGGDYHVTQCSNWVVERLGHIEDRTGGDAGLRKHVEPFVARALQQYAVKVVVKLGAMGNSVLLC